MADLDLALKIRAEARQAVRELQGTRQEMGRMGQSGRAADEDLRGLNQRVDELQRGLQGVQRTGRMVRNVLGALGVGFSIRAVFQATIEQERVLAQLDARIRSTGGAAGITRREMEDMASELQRVTTYGDEAVLAMQGVLLTFTNIRGDVFRETTPLILDMATALGTDLQSAAMQVGRALNDPVQGVSALTRAGVQFSQQQRDLIQQMVDTGDVAGAQRVILGELETQFGGSARAARDTFGGALQALRNAIGDLMEAEGGLPEAREELERLTELLQDPQTVEGANAIVSAIIRLVGVAAEGATEFANLGQQIGAWAAGITGNIGDLDRLEVQIKEVDRALRGSFMSRPLRFMFTSTEDLERLREQLVAERNALLTAIDGMTEEEREAANQRASARSQDTEDLARNLGDQRRLHEDHDRALEQARRERQRLERMADEVEAEFAPAAPSINAELENVLALYRELPAAQRALERGEFDEAAEGAQKLVERLRQAREEGRLSGPELQRLSREAAQLLRRTGEGREAEAAGIPIELDQDSLAKAVEDGRAWIRWAFEEEPTKVPVELELDRHSLLDNLEIPGGEGEDVHIPATLDTAPAAEEFRALAERLRAEAIRIPVQLDVGGAGGDSLQETIAREAAKRGRRG